MYVLLYTTNILQAGRCSVNTDAEPEYALRWLNASTQKKCLVLSICLLICGRGISTANTGKNDYITDRAFPLSMSTWTCSEYLLTGSTNTYDVCAAQRGFPYSWA